MIERFLSFSNLFIFLEFLVHSDCDILFIHTYKCGTIFLDKIEKIVV